MQIFSSVDEARQLDAVEFQPTGISAVRERVDIAWALRQVDTVRALNLGEQIERALVTLKVHQPERRRISARIALIRAESDWLKGANGVAEQSARAAMHEFEALIDGIGTADACLLMSNIEDERGATAARDRLLRRAANLARAAGDETRALLAEMTLARFQVHQNPQDALDRWNVTAEKILAGESLILMPCTKDFKARLASSLGEARSSIALSMDSFDAAVSTGQIRRAIATAINIGLYFISLRDHHGAEEWLQQGLALARPRGWPHSLGGCLYAVGASLTQQKRIDEATRYFQEALALLNGAVPSRYTIGIQLYLAQFEVDTGDPISAQTEFARCAEVARTLGDKDLENKSLRGTAKALAAQGLAQPAYEYGEAALQFSTEANLLVGQAYDCQTLAKICAQFQLPAPNGSSHKSGAIHFLTETLALVDRINLYDIELEALQSLSDSYAAENDHANAHDICRRMVLAAQRAIHREADDRATATTLRQAAERTRAETAYHKELAASEKLRAEASQQSSLLLEKLNAIGQEITAQLNPETVSSSILRHAAALIDVDYFSIHLISDDGVSLRQVYAVADSQPLPQFEMALSDKSTYATRCVASQEELNLSWAVDEVLPEQIPGTPPVRSALFVPLRIRDRVIGVMSVQSRRGDAYGHRARLIFRTLCAFGAIALDNAASYTRLESNLHQLRAAQRELVEKNLRQKVMDAERDETMAFLAHDLRAPLSAMVRLQAEAPDHATVRKAAGFAQRTLALTDRFLQIARMGRVSEESMDLLDLGSLVDEACEPFLLRAELEGKRVEAQLIFGCNVTAHHEFFVRGVANLIDNALKVSATGATVLVVMALSKKPEQISVSIIDQGPGLPVALQQILRRQSDADTLPRAGERLGLSIVAKMARLHNISVDVVASERGTTIKLSMSFGQSEPAVADS